MINIFIIDDHPVFIDGIKSIFYSGDDKIKVSGSANSAKEAFPKLKRSRARVVLLDLIMPEISGIEFSLVIKNNFPKKKVIALTGELDPTTLYNAWMNKVDAILMKYCGKDELVDAIHSVLSGNRVIGNNVPEFYNQIRNENITTPRLTKSEQQVLNLLSLGHTREKVSIILGSTPNAINFHCKNLFRKFEKNKLISVIEEAKKFGLIN